MSISTCPKCHRKGTYSAKFQQCGACGLGYESKSQAKRVESQRVEAKPIESLLDQEKLADFKSDVQVGSVVDLSAVTPSNDVSIEVRPGEVCSQCHEKKPSVAALKQRAWRAKRK